MWLEDHQVLESTEFLPAGIEGVEKAALRIGSIGGDVKADLLLCGLFPDGEVVGWWEFGGHGVGPSLHSLHTQAASPDCRTYILHGLNLPQHSHCCKLVDEIASLILPTPIKPRFHHHRSLYAPRISTISVPRLV